MLENTSNSATYVGTFDGQFTIPCEANTPGAQSRQIMKGKRQGQTVHYLAYNKLSGYLEKLDYRKHEHDGIRYHDLVLVLRSDAGRFQLELPVASDPAIKFFHVMESIDPAAPITLSIGKKDKDVLFFVQQHGAALKWNYTNTNKNGRPDWEPREEVDVDGTRKTVWSKVKQILFFLEILERIKPQFEAGWALPPAPDIEPPEYQATDVESLDNAPPDDLPF